MCSAPGLTIIFPEATSHFVFSFQKAVSYTAYAYCRLSFSLICLTADEHAFGYFHISQSLTSHLMNGKRTGLTELLREMSTAPWQLRSADIEASTSAEALSANAIVKRFLLQHEPALRRLDELREKVSICQGRFAVTPEMTN